MRFRPLPLAAFLLLMVLGASTSLAATSGLPAGIGVSMDPQGLMRVSNVLPGEAFSVYVVTDSLTSADLSGMRAAQFALEVDSRFLVIGRTPAPEAVVASQVAPDEWALGFGDCIGLLQHPFVLMRYDLLLPPGTVDSDDLRVGLRELTVYGEPMLYAACADSRWLEPLNDAGGLLLNPSSPAIAHLSGAPDVLVEGRELRLAWETARADQVRLDGVEVAATGRAQPAPVADHTYQLVAEGSGPDATASWSVEVIREPRIVSFTATAFAAGDEVRAQLAWNVRGADSVELVGVGSVFPRAGILLPVSDPPVWELRASNEWGTTTAAAALEGMGDLPPIVLSFGATPDVFDPGEPVVLSYTLYGADTASISPSPGAVDPTSGSVTVYPELSSRWTITATNAHGTAEASLDLTLRTVTIASFTADPALVFPGDPTLLSWNVLGAETLLLEPGVGPVTGPMGSVPVTPSADATVYTLQAANAEGEDSAQLTVGWKAPEATLTASDEAPFAGATITLTAEVLGADAVTLEPGIGPIDPAGGSFEVVVGAPTTFVLTATNAKGTTVRQVEVITAAPLVELSATPEEFFPQQPVELTAHIEGAESATLEPGLGTLAAGDHLFVLTITEPTTYVLTASNPAGTSVDSLTLVPKLPVVQISASDLDPYPDQEILLTVGILGADSATLEPGFGAIDAAGGVFHTLVPTETTFVATATNAAGSSTAEVTVVPKPPRIDIFSASPTTVIEGSTTTLSWGAAHAEHIRIDPGGFESDQSTGSWATVPTAPSTTYTLTASNTAGSTTAQLSVEVLGFSILHFTATPSSIPLGESSTLSWEVLGSAEVSIEGFGSVPMVGELVVEPVYSRQYVLVVTDGAQTRTRAVYVTVTASESTSIQWSWEPDGYPGVPPLIEDFIPFDVYAVALFPPDGLLGYEFSVDMTPCLVVLDAQPLPDGAINLGSLNNWIIGTGECVQGPVVPLVHYNLLALDETCLAEAVLSFGPSTPTSFDPPAPGLLTCLAEPRLRPFEVGDPLVLGEVTGIPTAVCEIDLSVAVHDEGTELQWTLPPEAEPTRLWLLRRCNEEGPQMVLDLRGEDACQRSSWIDRERPYNQCHHYRVVAEVPGGTLVSEEMLAEAITLPLPRRSHLLTNVPNPANPGTELRFVLAEPGEITLRIFDVSGRHVRTLRRSGLDAGEGSVFWNGTDARGDGVASGVYLVQLLSRSGTDSRRVALVK